MQLLAAVLTRRRSAVRSVAFAATSRFSKTPYAKAIIGNLGLYSVFEFMDLYLSEVRLTGYARFQATWALEKLLWSFSLAR